MQRVDLKDSNLNPNFIGSWIIEPIFLCDELISYFETHSISQRQGTTSFGKNLNVKNRTDISITPKQINLPGNEILKRYINSLFLCHKDYLSKWPHFQNIGNKLEIGKFNLGRYRNGQHFQKMHFERNNLGTLHRVLAWMTYLNDVDKGGSTYFNHYDLDIKPKKGLTLIWPAEWTHSHKGNEVKEGSKYIITGWMTFPE